MGKLDELYRLHRLIDGRRTGLSRTELIGAHGFARSTLTRLIAELRTRLGAPLVHDRTLTGEFLLGYHCQREALKFIPKPENNAPDEGDPVE